MSVKSNRHWDGKNFAKDVTARPVGGLKRSERTQIFFLPLPYSIQLHHFEDSDSGSECLLGYFGVSIIYTNSDVDMDPIGSLTCVYHSMICLHAYNTRQGGKHLKDSDVFQAFCCFSHFVMEGKFVWQCQQTASVIDMVGSERPLTGFCCFWTKTK